MAHQVALTVVADVPPEEAARLARLLDSMGNGLSNGSVLDFGRLSRVHFGRVLLLESTSDLRGQTIPASLVLMTEADAPLERHMQELATIAGAGLDELFGALDGYPPAGGRTPETRLEYLRRRRVREAAVYVNTIGRTRDQITREAQLRTAIEEFLDRSPGQWDGADAAQVRAAVQKHVRDDPALRWALGPPERPSLRWRVANAADLVALPLVALLLLPVAIVAAPVFIVLLRWHELRDKAPHIKPTPEQVRALAELEDRVAHNAFTAVGLVKPGPFRRLTIAALLRGADWATRHVFPNGNLAGVKTIHFARWVFLNEKRRVIFVSNYDGSLESYMDDFIDKVAWGLNGVFSNGVGYPKTNWLVLDGAHDELHFKDHLRRHQVPTPVWYTAYPELTAANIGNNARLRAGLSGSPSTAEATEWARRL
ncbi:MAG: hypothetical protein QOJ29_3750 [Thermoleophilaceae bacterium]|nr:hypothetical protein [Thermoleophilaceae bacterium]